MSKYLLAFFLVLGFAINSGLQEVRDQAVYNQFKVCQKATDIDPTVGMEILIECAHETSFTVGVLDFVLWRPYLLLKSNGDSK